MRALTILEPYASLIMLPESHLWHKRVENRNMPFSYRGPLLIHAGKSKRLLQYDSDMLHDRDYRLRIDEMTFGAIIGVAELVGCVHTGQYGSIPGDALQRWPWLLHHKHVEGPHCLVLAERRRFVKPIHYRGAQGLFNVPDNWPGLKEAIDAAIDLAG